MPFRRLALDSLLMVLPSLIRSPVGLNSGVKNPPLTVRSELWALWSSAMVFAFGGD